jgi:uncharacterized membrane protein YgcG
MKIRHTFVLLGMGAFCLAALPALGNVPTGPAQAYPEPGALNYVEGSAYLDGSEITNKNVGAAELNPDQVLHTGAGKAEVLLTPGVFLRIDDHSTVKMISPDIANTKVALLRGEAGVEVDEIHPQNDLQIVDNGVTTRLVKDGFYEFIASQPKVLVFSGEAMVEAGDGQLRKVKKDHQMVLLPGVDGKARHFDASNAEDGLYNWSKLRSQYLAEQNEQVAEENGWSGYYPGWYWNPMALGWDWGPWGPWAWSGWGPWWGGGFGFWGGYPGPIYYGHYGYGFHGHPAPARGFHGGEGFHGGGFNHGAGLAGGGFHGGGGVHGGGGFHGGRG